MFKLLVFIFFFVNQNIHSENILLGINGLAKVGNDCFLNISIKNKSKVKVKYLEALIFATNNKISSVGKSKIVIKNLENYQPYLTSKKIIKDNLLSCDEINIIDAHISKCIIIEASSKNECNRLLKVEEATNNNQIESVNKLENIIFYQELSKKDFLIPELNVILSPLNIKLANKYKIKKQRTGMVVIDDINNLLFKEGDLITYIEMNKVEHIEQVNIHIKDIIKSKKNLILINIIRQNKEKIIAAKIVK